VTSVPPRARLSLDGRGLGLTPQRREAFAGEHQVSLALPGYRSYEAAVSVSDGQAAQVVATLQKIEAPKPPPSAPVAVAPAVPAGQRVYKKWWFWTSFGLLTAAVVI